MASKVFISHKNTDSELARRVAGRVRSNGLDTYLDTIDDALAKDGPELANLLLQRMSECDQLIAVVSDQTKDSWWVPWEIGVGSEKAFRMASFSRSYVSLPSYLKKWPELHTDQDIDLYCQYSKATEKHVARQLQEAFSPDRRTKIVKRGAEDFHKQLMGRLSRGY
jgi:hypothetical protein